MIKSYNNFIICEPYKGKKALRPKITSGMATVDQTSKVVGIKVLADANISSDISIKKGSTIFIKEDVLHRNPNIYSSPIESDFIEKPFIMAHFSHIVFIKE